MRVAGVVHEVDIPQDPAMEGEEIMRMAQDLRDATLGHLVAHNNPAFLEVQFSETGVWGHVPEVDPTFRAVYDEGTGLYAVAAMIPDKIGYGERERMVFGANYQISAEEDRLSLEGALRVSRWTINADTEPELTEDQLTLPFILGGLTRAVNNLGSGTHLWVALKDVPRR